MAELNPYQTPEGDLEAGVADSGYGKVKIFSSRYRLGRLRFIAFLFGISLAFYLPFVIAFALFMDSTGAPPTEEFFASSVFIVGYQLYVLGSIVIMVIFMMLSIQRFHDMNATGWWAITNLIPGINFITLLVLYLVPGSKGPNRYGNPPPPNTIVVILLAAFAIFIMVFLLIGGIVVILALPAYLEYIQQLQ